jgi:hypothetical protein
VAWLVEARTERAVRAIRAAPAGGPVPAAAEDLDAADAALAGLAAFLEEEGRAVARRLRDRLAILLRAAAAGDPAERERLLGEAGAAGPGGGGK